MSDSCLQMEELLEVARLEAGDPGRTHLDQCPRCQANLASYEAFMNTEGLPDEADLSDARSKLGAALDREIFGAEAPGGETSAANPIRSLLDRLTAPALRPVWAVAAVVLLAIVIRNTHQPPGGTERTITLRGAETGTESLVTGEPRLLEDGGIGLSWQHVPAADRYEVAIYGVNLAEITRLDAGGETSLLLTPETLGELAAEQGTLFWRVFCLREGDPLASSRLGTLHLSE